MTALNGNIPPTLHQARSAALKLACDLIRKHPPLLLPLPGPKIDANGGSETPPSKKRRQAEDASDELQPEAPEKRSRQKQRGYGEDDPIVALLQLVFIMTPDRSEWRSNAANTVTTILSTVAEVEQKVEEHGKADGSEVSPSLQRFFEFLSKLLESERVACRTLGTEVAALCLERSELLAPGGNVKAQLCLVRHLLLALVRRCEDAVATVRTRALGGVGAALQSIANIGDAGRQELLKSVVLEPDHPQFIDLASLYRSGALDEKPTTRRAALILLDTLVPILHQKLGLSVEILNKFFDLNLLASLSLDESIMVRKGCIHSLAQLWRIFPESTTVARLWRNNVLPMVLDAEASVSDRALDEIDAAIIKPLPSGVAELPWILEDIDSEAMAYLQRALLLLAKRHEGQLPSTFVKSLLKQVQECVTQKMEVEDWPLATWCMLEQAMRCKGSHSLVNFENIFPAWVCYSEKGLSEADSSSSLGSKILTVLELLLPTASTARVNEFKAGLTDMLTSFTAPPPLIRAMARCVSQIESNAKAKKSKKGAAADTAQVWRDTFLKPIQAMLSTVVQGGEFEDKRVQAALFLLAELGMLDGSCISDGLVTQLKTLATNTVHRQRSGKRTSISSVESDQTCSNKSPEGGDRVELSAPLRAIAFAALGRCCLRKETLAKKSVELFVLYLNPNESVVVRNNVLLVLGDLCVHYTSLVDRFVPSMTELFRDKNELLRKQSAMIVASLLSEDFIKIRGSILLRFLYLLSDPAASVRHFAECVFARILHQRNAAIFAQNFLDVLCALNGWSGLSGFRAVEGNEEFSLLNSPLRRSVIYRFMLSLMTSDQKFNVCAQLVTTLLAAFVDAEDAQPLPTNTAEPAGQTLSDGLKILCCKEMRICFSTNKSALEDDDVDVVPDDKNAADAARGVLSGMLKKNMVDNILPVLVQLKGVMETQHSPFLKTLRHCLREVLRDFKDDLQAMLSGDPQLASEIAYDLQQEEHSGTAAVRQSGTGSGTAVVETGSSAAASGSSFTSAGGGALASKEGGSAASTGPGAPAAGKRQNQKRGLLEVNRPLPKIGGHSRRVSLATLMKSHSTLTATPHKDVDPPDTPCSEAGSAAQLRKRRRRLADGNVEKAASDGEKAGQSGPSKPAANTTKRRAPASSVMAHLRKTASGGA